MDSAERTLRDACEATGSGWRAHFDLGEYLYAQSRWTEAEAAYRKLDAIDRDAHSAFLIAGCLHKQEKFDEAEQFYRIAIELADDTDEFYGCLGQLLFQQERYEEAATAFEMAISDINEKYSYWRARCLVQIGHVREAEIELQRNLSRLQSTEEEMGIISDELAALIFNLLGVIRTDHDSRPIDALAMYGEALRRTPDNPIFWSNRAITEKGLGWKSAAGHSLGEAIRLDPKNDSYRKRLENLYADLSKHYESFDDFLEDGKQYLDAARWTDAEQSLLLLGVFRTERMWWSPDFQPCFEDYEITEEFLDESLARVESIADLLHLQVEFPVRLTTPDFEVLIDKEAKMLRAFVSSGCGVAVSIDLESWDLHFLAGDPDSMFAAGVALNFFLDCGINLARHPKFELTDTPPLNQASKPLGSNWSTTDAFDKSVADIRSSTTPLPPRAHRVKGFIRTLTYGSPSEDALSRAPSYIRRNMKPGQTFVRPHQRGGGAAQELLLRRLQTHSSLADYLATAPLRT